MTNCLSHIDMDCVEGINARIFEDKWRTLETLGDLIYSYPSFSTSCSKAFKDISLNVVQLDFYSTCKS